jgi:hypothetical protein
MTHETVVSLISQATGLASALILYWQAFGVEWQEQTIKGASPLELRKKTRQTYRGVTGLALAVFSIGCQTYLSFPS